MLTKDLVLMALLVVQQGQVFRLDGRTVSTREQVIQATELAGLEEGEGSLEEILAEFDASQNAPDAQQNGPDASQNPPAEPSAEVSDDETIPDLSPGTAVYRHLGAFPGESHVGGFWLAPGDFCVFVEAGGDDNPKQVREVLVGSWREFDDRGDFELAEGVFLDQAGWELHVGAAQQEAWALRQQVGTLPEGASPDELKPRAETWLAERANWTAEVAKQQSELATLREANLALEEKVASLEAALKAKPKKVEAGPPPPTQEAQDPT